MLSFVRQLADTLRAARRGRADMAELRAMSDEQLDDIGLCREQLVLLGQVRRRWHESASEERRRPEAEHWPELAPCG